MSPSSDGHAEFQSDHDVLVRIDEKVIAIHARMGDFVTRKEFSPVRSIAYGFVGIVLTSVIAAVLALVLRQ